MTEEIKKTLREEERALRRAAQKQALGYITAALGLVAGLAWNEAIQAAIAFWLPLAKNGIAAKFLYAVVITLAVVVASHYLTRFFKEDEKKS
ncbi:MAG TPA: DUF5654 family protein [Candidatus Paceibacterota bacterium]|nr:DUF5654 family protein [Candidatus Paceibacterota bacterium]